MADDEGQWREAVRRLEETVTRLETRIAHLEATRPLPPAAPVPLPTAAPAPERRDLEEHLGTYWLSRVGIVALILGFAFLIIYHFGELGTVVRVGLGYLLSAGLAALGLWLSRRNTVFGQIVFGGGLALCYFVTYALHFVAAVRVIDSEALALVLLALNTVGIVVIAQRMQSETVAGIALFLGLRTGMLSDITLFTLMSTALLAGGALFFLVKNRWVIVPLSSLVAVYLTHVVWATHAGAVIAPGQPPGERLALSLAFLGLYYVLFTVALLVHPRELSRRAALAFALLNWVGLLGLGAVEVKRWSEPHLFTFFVTLALAQGVGAAVGRLRSAPAYLLQTYLATAVLTLALGMPSRFDGTALVWAWTGVGLVAGLAGRGLGAGILQAVGVGVLYVAFGATWVPASGQALLCAALLGSFALVERGAVLPLASLPAPLQGRGRTALQLLCAAGVGLSGVGLLGELMPPGLTTLAWGTTAFGLFALGFALRERWYRLVALAVLALTLGRLMLVDLSGLPPNQRILTFILLGVMLLAVSYVYTRLRGQRGEP